MKVSNVIIRYLFASYHVGPKQCKREIVLDHEHGSLTQKTALGRPLSVSSVLIKICSPQRNFIQAQENKWQPRHSLQQCDR